MGSGADWMASSNPVWTPYHTISGFGPVRILRTDAPCATRCRRASHAAGKDQQSCSYGDPPSAPRHIGMVCSVACPGPWMWPACMLEDSGRASLAEATTVGHGNSLDTVKSIRDGANRGSAELDRTLQIYAAYLDDDVLASLSELRHSEYLFRVVHSEANTDFLDVPPDQRKYYPPDFLGYEKFWRLVVMLDQRLTRDDSNPGLWGPEYAHRGGGSENKTERKAA